MSMVRVFQNWIICIKKYDVQEVTSDKIISEHTPTIKKMETKDKFWIEKLKKEAYALQKISYVKTWNHKINNT